MKAANKADFSLIERTARRAELARNIIWNCTHDRISSVKHMSVLNQPSLQLQAPVERMRQRPASVACILANASKPARSARFPTVPARQKNRG